jgi:ubiquinone biosynthesis protein Coq4
MISETFGARLLATINDTSANPVHMLFNQWWNEASPEAKETYVSNFLADPEFREWYETGHYNDPLVLDELAALPAGSLGHTYRRWIVDNGLTAQIALDYRSFHTMLESSGVLDGMPDEMKYAVLRGFQIHDFFHVLTGYDSSGSGEIALQAFSLAQFQFPYFGMWMAVVTAQMTFIEPDHIAGLMDAISDGWKYGRSVSANLTVQPWETMLDQPLDGLRTRFGIELSPLAAKHEAARSPE